MRGSIALALSVLTLSAAAQTIQPKPRQNMMNEPFTADAITTVARTLADGTHITRQTMLVKMYRDSTGRTRSDRMPSPLLAGAPAPPATVLITDPLSGYSYILDTTQKIARRSAMPKGGSAISGAIGQPMTPPPAQNAPPPTPGKAQPLFKTEDLGTQFMEGLSVHGRRTTMTYPVGSIGNDREIANVSEIWSNTELGLMILQDRSDPRTGETVTKLENISRTQPDPTLFQPPADYKIVDVVAER